MKVRRTLPTMDEVEGVTCLEAQRALLGPPRAVLVPPRHIGHISRPGLARPLPP